MSADKRSVTTDALAVLGTIIDDSIGRDAIHLAVEPVTARESLYPGQDITLENGYAFGVPNGHPKALGIVDPFLSRKVFKGEKFLLVVYPRQINSLRHVWTHPGFPDETVKVSLVPDTYYSQHIKRVADGVGYTYDEVIEQAKKHLTEGYGSWSTSPSGSYKLDSYFWEEFEKVTGLDASTRSDDGYFSCSC